MNPTPDKRKITVIPANPHTIQEELKREDQLSALRWESVRLSSELPALKSRIEELTNMRDSLVNSFNDRIAELQQEYDAMLKRMDEIQESLK